MRFFSKTMRRPASQPVCRLCGKPAANVGFSYDYGLCADCVMRLDTKFNIMCRNITSLEEIVNSSTDPDEKITCLRLMLEELFDYKANLYDRGFDILDRDVGELIGEVIDDIAQVRIS
jgi:hypothetical protein